MKQEFEMTQEEMDKIIEINLNTGPVMMIGTVKTGMDRQKRINDYWDILGNKYGFNPKTVEGSSKGKLFFLAEPRPIVKPKTQSEIEMEKYDTLTKIVKQLEKCNYTCEAGDMIMNVAFMKLKLMAKDEN